MVIVTHPTNSVMSTPLLSHNIKTTMTQGIHDPIRGSANFATRKVIVHVAALKSKRYNQTPHRCNLLLFVLGSLVRIWSPTHLTRQTTGW